MPSAAPTRQEPTYTPSPGADIADGSRNHTLIWVLGGAAGVAFIVLVAVLTISWVSSTIFGGGLGASVPEDVQEDMTSDAVEAFSVHDMYYGDSRGQVSMTDLSLEIAGRGEPLPEERAQGVEEVVCYQVYMDYTDDGTPHTAVYHGFAFRTGDAWEVETIVDRSDEWRESYWKQHSCPGKFEPSDEHYRVYRDETTMRDPQEVPERSNESRGAGDSTISGFIVESLEAPPGWTCGYEDGGYVCTFSGDADRYAGIGVIDAEGYEAAYGVETAGPVTKAAILAETPQEFRSEMEEIEIGGLPAFRVCGDDGTGGVECNVVAGYDDSPVMIMYGASEEAFGEYEETFEAMLDGLRFQ